MSRSLVKLNLTTCHQLPAASDSGFLFCPALLLQKFPTITGVTQDAAITPRTPESIVAESGSISSDM